MNLRTGTSGPIAGWMQRVSVNWGAVGAAATLDAAGITVAGAAVGDAIFWQVNDATLNAGLVPCANGIVTAANTVTLRMANVTAAPIDPGVLLVDIFVLKRLSLAQS